MAEPADANPTGAGPAGAGATGAGPRPRRRRRRALAETGVIILAAVLGKVVLTFWHDGHPDFHRF